MLTFQWNSLRAGDPVLVHDDSLPTLGLRPGVVEIVQTRPQANDLAIRLGGDGVGRLAHPARLAVHLVPLDPADPCWRCEDAASAPAPAPQDAAGPARRCWRCLQMFACDPSEVTERPEWWLCEPCHETLLPARHA